MPKNLGKITTGSPNRRGVGSDRRF